MAMQRHDRRISLFNILNIAFLGMLALISILPFYHVLINSVMPYQETLKGSLHLIPTAFDWSSYRYIIADQRFLGALKVSFLVTVIGLLLNMILSVVGAYALSKKQLPGQKIFLGLILFTLYFNGGLIPYYMVIKSVGLVDNLWVMIIPPAINTMYLLIMKNYFATLPESLEESAKIDGANDLQILWKIIVPISAPFMATFALFYAVERWNEWWNAYMFISAPDKAPLQILLRQMLVVFSMDLGSIGAALHDAHSQVYVTGLQMTAIVVSSIPIVLVYPFLQKHFVKGIALGSIKE